VNEPFYLKGKQTIPQDNYYHEVLNSNIFEKTTTLYFDFVFPDGKSVPARFSDNHNSQGPYCEFQLRKSADTFKLRSFFEVGDKLESVVDFDTQTISARKLN